MALEDKRKELVEVISQVEDEALIDQLLAEARELLSAPNWEDLPADVRAGIQEGQEDFRAGRSFSNEEVMKDLKKRYPNVF